MAIMQYIFSSMSSLQNKQWEHKQEGKLGGLTTNWKTAQRVILAATETRKVGCKRLRPKNPINFIKISYWGIWMGYFAKLDAYENWK